MQERSMIRKIPTALVLLGAAGLIGFWVWWAPDWAQVNAENVRQWVEELGLFGPFAIIALMAIAVVASPIPSAPIALAAGAAFGHVTGTLYVAIGAEIGAMIAFMIARYLGRQAVEKMLGSRVGAGLLGSQNALTLAIFLSRLLPFVSFDAMSYAAGLSRLHLWRFGLATLAGILPASFLLAHIGIAAIDGSFGMAEWIALGLGLTTGLPLLYLALRRNSAATGVAGGRDDP